MIYKYTYTIYSVACDPICTGVLYSDSSYEHGVFALNYFLDKYPHLEDYAHSGDISEPVVVKSVDLVNAINSNLEPKFIDGWYGLFSQQFS